MVLNNKKDFIELINTINENINNDDMKSKLLSDVIDSYKPTKVHSVMDYLYS